MVLSFKTISSAHANPAKTELEYTSDPTQHPEIRYKQDMIGMTDMIGNEVQIYG
jgi:hypothetical protein